jgi:hypothetical protein
MVWLAFIEAGQSLQEVLGDCDIRFDVRLLVAILTGIETRLFDVYRVAPGTPLRAQLLGPLTALQDSPANSYIYSSRKSLEGYTMKTASLNVSRNPYVSLPLPQLEYFTLVTLWRRSVLPVRYKLDCKYCYK